MSITDITDITDITSSKEHTVQKYLVIKLDKQCIFNQYVVSCPRRMCFHGQSDMRL